MNSLDLILPFPPSANRYWRVFQGRVIKSVEAREYQKRVRLIALKHQHAFKKERLRVEIECYPPDKRARDLDNQLKILIDALEFAQVFENDSQIDELFIKRCEPVTDGLMKIKILTLSSQGLNPPSLKAS